MVCQLLVNPLRLLMDGAAALQFAIGGNSANTLAVGKAYAHFLKWLFSKENKQ